jgi:hypothetical protein
MLLSIAMPAVVGSDGHLHDVLAEALHRPTALIFISHDCPVCNTYAPEFARITKRYAGMARVDLVYCDPLLTVDGMRQHASQYGLAGAGLFLDKDGRMARACKATTTPEAAVFDEKGRETYVGRIDDLFANFGKQRSAATHHDLRVALDATLAHRPAPPAAGPPVGCAIERQSVP